MRNKILAVVIFLLPVGVFLYFWFSPNAIKTSPALESQNSQDAAVKKALATANPQTTAIIASNFSAPPQTVFYAAPAKPPIAPAGAPSPLEFTNVAPEVAMDYLRHAISDYSSMFGGNPVGNNAEITSQLGGRNPKQANFIQPENGMRINSDGELVDPWGTPYFFHQLSGTHMDVRSAGPDRVMWTADDLMVPE